MIKMEAMLTATEKAHDVLSTDEFKSKLNSLSEAQWIKLGKMADYFSWGLAIEGQDLLNIALTKVLEGKRKCPNDLCIIVFLRRVIESLVSAYLKKRKRDPLHQTIAPKAEDEDSSDIVDLQPTIDSPEEMLIAKQTLDEINRVFNDDETIQMVLMAQLDGYSPLQIQETVGLTVVQYASVLKAIRRKLDKLTK